MWANHGYTRTSMLNDHVAGVPSLRGPDYFWRRGRADECSAAPQRELVELCDGLWDDVWVWSISNLPAVKHW